MMLLTWLLLLPTLFWTYLLVNSINNLRHFKKLPFDPDYKPEGEGPVVSIVVPARNEERDVEAAVTSMLEQTGIAYEVIVVDDQSTDRTPEILNSLKSRYGHLRVITAPPLPEGWLGKCHALQTGALTARGKYIVFADADVHFTPDTARDTASWADKNELDYLCMFPDLKIESFWERMLMPILPIAANLAPIRLVVHPKQKMFAIGGGAFALLRRSVYEESGRHEAIKNAVIDDVGLAFRMKKLGYRYGLMDGTDRVAVRMYHSLNEIVQGFTKNYYMGLGGRWWSIVGFCILTAWMDFLPYVAAGAVLFMPGLGESMAWGAYLPFWILFAILIGRIIIFKHARYPLRYTPMHLPMVIVLIYIAFHSAFHVGFLGKIPWRGRNYDPQQAGSVVGVSSRISQKQK